LVAREGTLKGFIVAGEDRTFVPAEGAIDGDSILIWSDKVPHPVAVRYAWGNNPPFSLFNKEGLPASPFRTDDWPGRTYGMTRMFVDENP
jgi:sialate O-acetylesterase